MMAKNLFADSEVSLAEMTIIKCSVALDHTVQQTQCRGEFQNRQSGPTSFLEGHSPHPRLPFKHSTKRKSLTNNTELG